MVGWSHYSGSWHALWIGPANWILNVGCLVLVCIPVTPLGLRSADARLMPALIGLGVVAADLVDCS